MAPGQHIKMDVLGLKVKLLGDAILDADTWVPQVALGLEHKQVRPDHCSRCWIFWVPRQAAPICT